MVSLWKGVELNQLISVDEALIKFAEKNNVIQLDEPKSTENQQQEKKGSSQ